MKIQKIDRDKIFNKFNGKCAYCGCEIEKDKFQIDHLICKEWFGLHKSLNEIPFLANIDFEVNDEINLMPACAVCNRWKSSMKLSEFRYWIGEQLRILNENSANFRFAKKYNLVQETPHQIEFHFEKYLG